MMFKKYPAIISFLYLIFLFIAPLAPSQTIDLKSKIDCKGAGNCAAIAEKLERDGLFKEALVHYERAGLNGSKNSFAHLAGHHFFGIGTPQNTQEGYKYLILSTTFNLEHEPNTLQSFIAPYKQFSLEPEIEATILKAGDLAKIYAKEHSQKSFYRERRINVSDLVLDNAYIDRLVKGHLREIEHTRNGRNNFTEFCLIIIVSLLANLSLLLLKSVFPRKLKK